MFVLWEKRCRKGKFLGLLVLLLLLSSLGCENRPDQQAGKEQVAGVTDTEILFGSSCALTGHASFLGTQTLHGALAYFNHINEKGGIHGRRIKLLAYDDAYDPAQCVVNTQKLIGEDKVFALTCYVGTPTAVKIIAMVEEARIPLLGLFTGASALREPFKPYILNVRASYYQETGEVVKHLVEDLGIQKLAVFYQYDEYGFDGLTGAELALEGYQLKPVAKASYIRGSTDVQEAVEHITNSEAEAVIMIGTYGPCADFIKLARERKPCMVFHNVSFVGAEELVSRLGPDAEGVIITQVVPPPWETTLLPAAEEYNKLLKRLFPDDKPNFVSFEGYVNAKVLVQALRRVGREVTRERFIEEVEQMEFYSPGIGANISFGKKNHQGLDRVYVTMVKDGKLVLLNEWSQVKPCRK